MKEKTQLLALIAGKNRGLLSNESDQVAIFQAIEKLEGFNPTPNPLEAKNLLEGDWRLLYTTSRGLLGLDRFPFLRLGQIYQSIRTEESKIYNIAEIEGIPFFEAIVSVCASFVQISENKVKVNFERSIICLQKLIDYRSPSQFIKLIEDQKHFTWLDFPINNREQKGWLEITYLDADMRIGRGNEGNLFVLVKD
jgi:hypothetical protein